MNFLKLAVEWLKWNTTNEQLGTCAKKVLLLTKLEKHLSIAMKFISAVSLWTTSLSIEISSWGWSHHTFLTLGKFIAFSRLLTSWMSESVFPCTFSRPRKGLSLKFHIFQLCLNHVCNNENNIIINHNQNKKEAHSKWLQNVPTEQQMVTDVASPYHWQIPKSWQTYREK